MVEIVKPSVLVLLSIKKKKKKMKYAQVENRAVYEEWANSVGTGLDKLHGGRTKFALFLTLLSVGNMWRTILQDGRYARSCGN